MSRRICRPATTPEDRCSQRLVASDERLLLGAGGTYEARCRKCFDPTLAGSPAAKAETKRET